MKAIVFVGTVCLAVGAMYDVSECYPWCRTTTTAELFTQDTLRDSLDRFHQTIGRFPTTEEGLAALVEPPQAIASRWKGPYVQGGKIPLDPWGRPYQYRAPGVRSNHGFDVWSLGPDGKVSDDDVGNWSK